MTSKISRASRVARAMRLFLLTAGLPLLPTGQLWASVVDPPIRLAPKAKLRSLLAVSLSLVCGLSITQPLSAATIYFQFSGHNADVNIDGNALAGQDWLLEFGIDTTVADQAAPPFGGDFPSAPINGHIRIGSTLYALDASDFAFGTSVILDDQSGFGGMGDRILVLTPAGGLVEIDTADDQIFPAVFTNVNDLSSAILEASVTNSTATYGASVLDCYFWPLFGADGEVIMIREFSESGSGGFTFTVTATSIVPEPSSFILAAVGMIGVAAWGWRRRASAAGRKNRSDEAI